MYYKFWYYIYFRILLVYHYFEKIITQYIALISDFYCIIFRRRLCEIWKSNRIENLIKYHKDSTRKITIKIN